MAAGGLMVDDEIAVVTQSSLDDGMTTIWWNSQEIGAHLSSGRSRRMHLFSSDSELLAPVSGLSSKRPPPPPTMRDP